VLQQAQRHAPDELRLFLFFSPSRSGQAAGRPFIERQGRRTADRDPASSAETVAAQAQAIVHWGLGSTTESAARLARITQPALIVNGTTRQSAALRSGGWARASIEPRRPGVGEA
jgi:hypothetical protein